MRVAATITTLRQATPTVRTLSLAVADPTFTFLPGQWVDFYVAIGGREQVAGYSITSSPLRRGSIDLAVKQDGVNPVTHYVHNAAREGDRVTIAVGGDFTYRADAGSSLVLIAGGIGINPIMSILRYVDEAAPEVAATVLYSVRSPCELLFGDEIRAMAKRRKHIRAYFTTTRATGTSWHDFTGRIDASMLQSIDLDPSASYYLCGPPAMVQTIQTLLTRIGVDRMRLNYESW